MILNFRERQLLSKILEENNHQYDEFMNDFQTPAFPKWKVDLLCNWINDEFMMSGLNEDDNPNEYGLQLERLIDTVNRQSRKA